MRGLRELVFSTTNQCPASCEDCPVVFGHRPPTRLSADEMVQLIDEVAAGAVCSWSYSQEVSRFCSAQAYGASWHTPLNWAFLRGS